LSLSNCDINAGQNISFINETKTAQNFVMTNRLGSKNLLTLLPNFVKGRYKTLFESCPFSMEESEQNESKG
jgi:hypothetical protein